MSFGRWLALDDAAPEGPGLLQARRKAGLIDYPTGKSAMVYYDADDESVARALGRLQSIVDNRDAYLVRYAPGETTLSPRQSIERHLKQFESRFGALPIFNRRTMHG
ncbi:MAG TPA: hypothetical protein VJ891_18925 [Casimicrobiaceae bacterium]|nr:hypothetical protein [Casimicrobiaceae bacterium]